VVAQPVVPPARLAQPAGRCLTHRVTCDAATGEIAGYVALSAAQIEREYLPKAARRNQPDPLPAILLGQLAIDLRYQGRGCARSLMWFALTTAVRLSKDIGCFGVVTHPIDDSVRAFYTRYGFESCRSTRSAA